MVVTEVSSDQMEKNREGVGPVPWETKSATVGRDRRRKREHL